jgi:hypothetical protein
VARARAHRALRARLLHRSSRRRRRGRGLRAAAPLSSCELTRSGRCSCASRRRSLSPKRDSGEPSSPSTPSGHGQDPEDKQTELWARAAPELFETTPFRRRSPAELDLGDEPQGATPTPAQENKPDTVVERVDQILDEQLDDPDDEQLLAPRQERPSSETDTLPGFASAREDPDPCASPSGAIDDDEPEERDTQMVSGEFDGDAALGHELSDSGVREAEAEARRLLSDSVELAGEVGEAARRLAEEERARARAADSSLTMVVEARRGTPRLSHECRVCGRRITAPAAARFRGPPHGDRGFRCDACSNAVCAAHVERVSGLIETVLLGGRFRCVLCSPDAHPPARRR